YGQRDPLQEYKGESFELFQAMLANLRQAVTSQMARVELVQEDPLAQAKQAAAKMLADGEGSDEFDASEYGDEELDFSNLPEGWQNTRRNDPCPCGSGKKFKHCHGKYV
ncbi:MAG: SEC-C domain-containing protein, partial [Nitratireductor sp.]|nr:SEC-C domain-containing protein [Nitratireductor sp.]